MKIATWNVNGIRARAEQLQEWLEAERPDVVCLQELKAELSQIPEVCRHPDYHAYWHTLKGYSGVSLQVRKELCPTEPVYSHPPFDMESRIVQVDQALGAVVIGHGHREIEPLPRGHERRRRLEGLAHALQGVEQHGAQLGTVERGLEPAGAQEHREVCPRVAIDRSEHVHQTAVSRLNGHTDEFEPFPYESPGLERLIRRAGAAFDKLVDRT